MKKTFVLTFRWRCFYRKRWFLVVSLAAWSVWGSSGDRRSCDRWWFDSRRFCGFLSAVGTRFFTHLKQQIFSSNKSLKRLLRLANFSQLIFVMLREFCSANGIFLFFQRLFIDRFFLSLCISCLKAIFELLTDKFKTVDYRNTKLSFTCAQKIAHEMKFSTNKNDRRSLRLKRIFVENPRLEFYLWLKCYK